MNAFLSYECFLVKKQKIFGIFIPLNYPNFLASLLNVHDCNGASVIESHTFIPAIKI